MTEQALRERLQAIVDDLFTNGNGEKADRLVLMADEGPDLPGRDLGGWCRSAVVDRLLAALSAPAAKQKPPRAFYNTRWSGEGFGTIGEHRVVVRRERKGAGRTYVQIINNDDGVGVGFTAKEVEALIPALQRAAQSCWPAAALSAPAQGEGRRDAMSDIECACCGDIAATGEVHDGQALACGCTGRISCDTETEPWVNANECDCGGMGRPTPPREPAPGELDKLMLSEHVEALESRLAEMERERDMAQAKEQALLGFLETCLCDDCGGQGVVEGQYVNDSDTRIECLFKCLSCDGTGHDSRKAFEQVEALTRQLLGGGAVT